MSYKTYLDLGWEETFPLPAGEKFPPPAGVTGNAEGVDADKAWSNAPKDANLGIRCPDGIIFIDIDDYGEKYGLTFFAEQEQFLGVLNVNSLPRSSRRGPNSFSGQYPFKVPKGIKWASSLCPDVDIIQHTHRYTVSWPSVIGETEYKWYLGTEELDSPPHIDDIPELPEDWVNALKRGVLNKRKKSIDVNSSDEEVYKSAIRWLADNLPAWGKKPSPLMKRWRDSDIPEKLAANAHDTMVNEMKYVIYSGVEGESGTKQCLSYLKKSFMAEVVGDHESGRSQETAEKEWRRAFLGCVENLKEEVSSGKKKIFRLHDALDRLGEVKIALAKRNMEKSIDLDVTKYDQTDAGYCDILVDCYQGKVKALRDRADADFAVYSEELGRWEFQSKDFSLGLVRHSVGKVYRNAEKAARKDYEALMDKSARGELEADDPDPEVALKTALKYKKIADDLGNTPRQNRILGQLKSHEDAKSKMSDFDCHQNLLGLPSGEVLDLEKLVSAENPVRPAKPEDMVTMSLGAPYMEGATHVAWDTYLERHLPDKKVRRFIQKALGYTLVDYNPNKLLFFLAGPSDTGKTLILEAMNCALGDYSGAPNANKFFGDSGSGPNAEMIHNLARRFVIFSEVGADQNLSASSIKRVTGGDMAQFRGMFSSKIVEGTPHFTPYISTNNPPNIEGIDKATQRRIVVLPFGNVHRTEGIIDPELDLRRNKEAWPAILQWILEGYVMYMKEGLNQEEWIDEVKEASSTFKREMSPFEEFTEESLLPAKGKSMKWDDFYRMWEQWALKQGFPPQNKISFGRTAAKFGIKKVRKLIDGKRHFVLEGYVPLK